MNKYQTKGRVKETKGTVKEVAGRISDDINDGIQKARLVCARAGCAH